MKTRIEVLTQETVYQILEKRGYIYDCDHRYLLDENGNRHKISWIHRNAWNQITYIDLIIV